jgi:hypothetical protein
MGLKMLAGYVITNCGYRGNHELWFLWCASFRMCILIKQLMVLQCNSSSSPPLMLLPQHVSVYYCMPLDDGRMTKACCGNNIRGEEEMLR